MDINGMEFFESADASRRSPEDRFAADSSGCTRRLQMEGPVDQERRYRAAKALVGHATLRSDTNGVMVRRWIERTLPHGWKWATDDDVNQILPVGKWAADTVLESDGLPQLRCSSVPRIAPRTGHTDGGLDESTAAIFTRGAWVDVQYSAYPYFHREDADMLPPAGVSPLSANAFAGAAARPDEGGVLASYGWAQTRYIIREYKHAPKVATVAGSIIKYAEGDLAGKPVPGSMQFTQYRASVKYTWVGVPVAAIPHQAIGYCTERVNANDFDFAAPGTMKLEGNDIHQYRGPLGDMLADVTYYMMYLPNYSSVSLGYKGWNSIAARKPDNVIDYVYVSADGVAPGGANSWFKSADFSACFRPPQVPA